MIPKIDNNENIEVNMKSDDNWLMEIDIPEELYDTTEEYYRVTKCENENFNIYTAKVTNTGFEIGLVVTNAEKPTYPFRMDEIFLSKEDVYSGDGTRDSYVKFYGEEFIKEAEKLLLENNNKVVIKANESCEGKDVYCCSNKQEIEDIVNKLFKSNKDTLSACPYVDIDYEYRAIYLCNEILYIYKKKKASVFGDGKRKLLDLINEKNQKNNIKIEIINNLDLNYVPKNKEEITISWKHNLSNGATPIIIDENDEYIEQIRNVALLAGNAMNIKFASIDIALTSDKKILVMEVNGSVCMNKFSEVIPNGYEISKNIYRKAIHKMFED